MIRVDMMTRGGLDRIGKTPWLVEVDTSHETSQSTQASLRRISLVSSNTIVPFRF